MDWQNWCRLCGNNETIIKIEPEVEELASKLNILEHNFKICVECNAFLSEIYQFVARSKLIDAMFLELEQLDHQQPVDQFTTIAEENVETKNFTNEFEYDKSIADVRQRFGLKPLEMPVEMLATTLFEEPNVVIDSVEIKLESELGDFEANELLSEDQDLSESSEEEEDNSEIEQLSDSKFKRHKDSIRYQDGEGDEGEDSTDSGGEERKNAKKYQKSEAEKLYDFVCHICKKEFDKMCFLTRHCRRVHKCIPQVNCFCGKQLGTWKRLLIHKQLHFPEKVDYECKECKLTYKLKASYESHMKKKHGPDAKKFVCSQCARCFKNSRILASHEKTHLPDDLKLTHLCVICNKKFVNKNSLKSHITSVHEMANLYTCETCGKGFSTKSNLKSHLYVHSDKKDVQCDVCSARFKNMDSLRKHKKSHLEKSQVCIICGNVYRNRNNLKAHMVCHSNVKAFQCTFCPNSYKRSKDLKCHLNLHTGERPYQCQFCSRTFVNGSNCRKHKLKDHPEELAAFESIHGRGKSAVQALQTIHTP
ncbi:CLUMA_CG000778, isoform A [Clunio marinus]|uniref:CLUMA_CG000778, isoform A n=1 Tax=Clunio marinus TaxID=568069 RepID=A0A1J1HHC7_9DIPT|nr:CLUMA_CG000778, isoform A [Clunio marinus]